MTGEYLDWAEKYRPVTLTDIIGNDAAVKTLREWAKSYGDGGKKAVILYGSPGVGKTSAALALAHDMGWDYIEMNASDQRTKDVINKIAGSASSAGTFEGGKGRRLIIIDEADNLHGNYDRGGEAAINNVIKNASQPIVLIANDLYALSKPLREATQPIQFRAILSASVAKALRNVCHKEGITCQPEALMKIAERTGDLRSAINDLQAAAQGNTEVEVEDVATGERDVPETIFKVMGMIFQGRDMKAALDATYGLDENPQDLIAWVDENLPRAYRDDDLEKGFDAVSRADIFLGRVMRRQDYGMWRYAGFMMVCGVNQARKHRYGGYVKYGSPTYWQKLGRAKSMRTVRDSLAAKLGAFCHTSKSVARSSYIPLLKFIFSEREYAVKLSALLKLEEEEIAFLLDSKKTVKKVSEIYKESRTLIQKEVEHDIDVFGGFEHKVEKVKEDKPVKERKAKDGGEPGPVEIPAVIVVAKPKEEPQKEVKEEKQGKKQRTLFEF